MTFCRLRYDTTRDTRICICEQLKWQTTSAALKNMIVFSGEGCAGTPRGRNGEKMMEGNNLLLLLRLSLLYRGIVDLSGKLFFHRADF